MRHGATHIMVALGCLGLALGLALIDDQPVAAQGVVADPPILVRLDGPARLHLPEGGVVLVPAGTEIGACGAAPLRYDPDARVLSVPEPCIEATLFVDGFEAP